MTGFYVAESALDTAADRLEAIAAQQAPAAAYVDEHLRFGLGDTGALLATVLATTGPAADDVRDALAGVADHLRAAARELRSTATLYRSTDDETDRRLDATYG